MCKEGLQTEMIRNGTVYSLDDRCCGFLVQACTGRASDRGWRGSVGTTVVVEVMSTLSGRELRRQVIIIIMILFL